MKISVIIPSYNRGFLLRQMLTSLVNQQPVEAEVEIVIVSGGDSCKIFEELSQVSDSKFSWREVVVDAPLGPGYFKNAGVGVSQGELLLFLDDDVTLPSNFLAKVLHHSTQNPDDAAWGGVSITGNSATLLGRYLIRCEKTWKRPSFVDGQVLFIPGLNMVVRSKSFSQTIGFAKSFSHCCEDSEFCLQLREQNLQLGFNPNQVLFHREVNSVFHFYKKMFTYGTMNLLLKKRQKKICMNGIRGVLRNYWSWFAYFSKGKNLEEKLLHPMMGICRDFIYHLGVISGGLIS